MIHVWGCGNPTLCCPFNTIFPLFVPLLKWNSHLASKRLRRLKTRVFRRLGVSKGYPWQAFRQVGVQDSDGPTLCEIFQPVNQVIRDDLPTDLLASCKMLSLVTRCISREPTTITSQIYSLLKIITLLSFKDDISTFLTSTKAKQLACFQKASTLLQHNKNAIEELEPSLLALTRTTRLSSRGQDLFFGNGRIATDYSWSKNREKKNRSGSKEHNAEIEPKSPKSTRTSTSRKQNVKKLFTPSETIRCIFFLQINTSSVAPFVRSVTREASLKSVHWAPWIFKEFWCKKIQR